MPSRLAAQGRAPRAKINRPPEATRTVETGNPAQVRETAPKPDHGFAWGR